MNSMNEGYEAGHNWILEEVMNPDVPLPPVEPVQIQQQPEPESDTTSAQQAGGGEAAGYRHSHVTYYKNYAGRDSIRAQIYTPGSQGTWRIRDFSGYGNMQALVTRPMSAH